LLYVKREVWNVNYRLDATRNVLELRPLPELSFSAPEKLALPTSLDQQSKLARICQGIEKKGV